MVSFAVFPDLRGEYPPGSPPVQTTTVHPHETVRPRLQHVNSVIVRIRSSTGETVSREVPRSKRLGNRLPPRHSRNPVKRRFCLRMACPGVFS